MSKVLLVIPPYYEYTFPTLGTPALCAFLRQNGIHAEQADLNLKYRDFLAGHISGFSIDASEKRVFLSNILKKFFKEKLKGRYYSQFLVRENDGIFPYLPYDDNTNGSFCFAERLLSSEYLWRYLEDGAENTFSQFYEKEKILDFLDRGRFGLLGISIISPSQAIASLTLGMLVKKHLPHIHVSIGGQWPTLYRDALSGNKDFFRCFDSIIVFEGETPLLRLAVAIKDKRNIQDISNIILKDAASDAPHRQISEDLNLLPCPDFDNMDLDGYDGARDGKRKVTYEASRGCYWSRCAFCTDVPLPRPAYREKRPELVARDIKRLKERYGATHIFLSDPGVSPRHMEAISEAILKEDVKITLWCMARLDPDFNYRIFKLAARAGFEQINFGFESAGDRICDLLDKGNKKERSLRIIKECSKAGIRVDLQTILGLPTETFNDGMETIDFLVTNKKFISDVTFNIYYINPANLIYQNPAKYGIECEEDPSLPFRYFTPFKNPRGMTANEACLLQQLYASYFKEKDDRNGKIQLDETLVFAKAASADHLEFTLNGESVKMGRLYNDETSMLLDEREEPIVDCVKNGLGLKDIHSSLAEAYSKDEIEPLFYNLIEGCLKSEFFVRKG